MNGIIFTESTDQKQIRIPSDIQDACLNHFLISSKIIQHPFHVQIPVDPIKQISCNQDTVLAVSQEGLIFGWGKNSSCLIHPDPVPIASPVLISDLKGITQVSLSKTHAAAIDEKGLLYTWGCPLYGKLGYTSNSPVFKPELVVSSRAYKSIQVSCGLKYTSIRTDGCYVHIYGLLGQGHALAKKTEIKSPKAFTSYSHPEIDKYSIVDLSAGMYFLAVLADSGEVFVFDQCMDVVKLPVKSESRVLKILAGEKSLWGLSSDSLYFWKSDGRGRNYCDLASWQAKVYETSEVKLYTWGSAFLIITSDTLEPVYELRPYKRTEYAKKLFVNAFESPSLSLVKEARVPVLSFDDLERLFPNGDSQNTMDKIIKLRIEHYRYEKILKAFSPVVHPVAIFALNKVKEYAWMNYLYKRTVKVSNMVGVFSSYVKQTQSMAKLKFLWKLKELNRIFFIVSKKENIEKIEKGYSVLYKKWDDNVRDVFTAVRVKKPVKAIEALKKQLKNLSLKKCETAFFKIGKKARVLKQWEKVFKIYKRFIVRKALLGLQRTVKKAENSAKKLKNLYRASQKLKGNNLKFAFNSLKRSAANLVLLNFHKKYVLELFLKLLTQVLSIKIFSSYSESFISIKSYTKKPGLTHPLTSFLNQLSLRLKNSVFKQLTQSPKNPFTPLKYLVKSRFSTVLSQVFFAVQQTRIKQIAFLAVTLQKVLSNCLFKQKLHIFYRLKHRNLSRTHSVNNNEEIPVALFDSSLEISKRSIGKNQDAFLTTPSEHKFFHRGHSASSLNAVRRSHCCFHGSPYRVTKTKKSYRYYKGEKVTYEKYLILKKIHEFKDSNVREKISPVATPKRKKVLAEKPPWKPTSSNTANQKEFSAIKKGFEYNEEIRKKLMKKRSSNDMNDSKNTAFTHDKGLIKVNKKPLTDSMSNIASLPFSNDSLSINLAVMSIQRGLKWMQKRLKRSCFELLKTTKKSIWKLPAPTPDDSLKLVQHLDTINMIKSDWQYGMVVIAVDNFKTCVRKIVARELFDILLIR